ncbi:MAG: TonB-dependent receptor domain-containing protein, partial [Candidatus Kapaibacterium sp.]
MTYASHHINSRTRRMRTGFRSLLLLLILCGFTAKADELRGTVRGREAGSTASAPLGGAYVRWVSASGTVLRAARTATDGSFALERERDARLVVSYIGFRPDTLSVAVNATRLSIELLPEMQTEAVRVEAAATTISAAPIRTEVIRKAQLEKSACCSLAESFEKSPSVEVTFSDAATGAKQIQLLGLRGLYSQTTTDVVPLMRGLAIPFGLEYIPGPFIEGICISKGAGSVLNGYEGITGLINIDYKRPQEDVPFYLNVYGNTNGRGDINLTTAHHLNDNWSVSAMAHARWMQTEIDQNNDGFNDMPMMKTATAVGRAMYQNDEGREFQVFGKYVTDDLMSGTTHGSEQAHSDHGFEIHTKVQRYESYAKFAMNPLFEHPETRMGIQIATSGQTTLTHIDRRTYNAAENMLFSKLIFTTTASDDLNIAYGASYMLNTLDERFDATVPRDSLQEYYRRESVPGVFAELTYKPLDELVVVAGARVDAHNLYGTFGTPRVNVKYDASENITVRASAGSGLRVANAISDNIASLVNQRQVNIQSGLRPEKAWNYGGSFTATWNVGATPFTFDAEFYRTVFSEQVVVDMDRSLRAVDIRNLNGGESFSNSALVQVKSTPADRLDLSLAYRLIDAQTTTGGLLRQRPLISPHRVLATAGYA